MPETQPRLVASYEWAKHRCPPGSLGPLAALRPLCHARALPCSVHIPCLLPPQDGFHLYFTSGTTGLPKAVMLSHRIVVRHALSASLEHRIHEGDVWGHIAPMFHLVDVFAVYTGEGLGESDAFVSGCLWRWPVRDGRRTHALRPHMPGPGSILSSYA